jgi:hypothetical protein
MGRELRAQERIGAHPLLGEHERQYFSVEGAVSETDDAVHSHGNERAGSTLEHRRPERTSCPTNHILPGKLDRELHPAVIGLVAGIPVDGLLHPLRARGSDREALSRGRYQKRLCSLSTARLLEPMVMSAWNIPLTPTFTPWGGGLDPSLTTVSVPVPSFTW